METSLVMGATRALASDGNCFPATEGGVVKKVKVKVIKKRKQGAMFVGFGGVGVRGKKLI